MGQRYRRTKDQKLWPSLAFDQDFTEGRLLKPKVMGTGGSPQPLQFLVIFRKKLLFQCH